MNVLILRIKYEHFMNFMKTYDKMGENTLKHPHLQQIVKAAAIAAAV
jgi:hypothetical protein